MLRFATEKSVQERRYVPGTVHRFIIEETSRQQVLQIFLFGQKIEYEYSINGADIQTVEVIL